MGTKLSSDFTQYAWDKRGDIRAYAESMLSHDDDRGLLGALVLLGMGLADCHDHETLVHFSAYHQLLLDRRGEDYCPACHRAVTSKEEILSVGPKKKPSW